MKSAAVRKVINKSKVVNPEKSLSVISDFITFKLAIILSDSMKYEAEANDPFRSNEIYHLCKD